MSANGIDKVSNHERVRSGQNQAKRKEKAAARAEKRQARAAKRKEASSEPAATTPTPTPTPTPSSGSTTTASPSSDAPTSESASSSQARKNFIGDLKGAKIVNFAVQGGQANNAISVFASGEGPNAKKVSSNTEKTASSSDTTKVDTVA